MAVSRYCSQPSPGGICLALWVCDTEGERTPGVRDGDRAFCKDTNRLYVWNGSWIQPNAPPAGDTIAYKSSDQLTIGTAYADVAGTGLAVLASKAYAFQFVVIADADAVTTGIDLAVNGPGSPTAIVYTSTLWTSATTQIVRPFAAYDGNPANPGSAGTTRSIYIVQGTLVNGNNAGTLIARVKRENVGSANVRAGSYGRLTQLN
jgi:hypothetical protein